MRVYGLTPEQLGAILRLAADNQNFDDEVPERGPMLRVIEGAGLHFEHTAHSDRKIALVS